MSLIFISDDFSKKYKLFKYKDLYINIMKIWEYKNDKLEKLVEKDNDICFTNPEMAKHLLSLIEFKDNDVVIEPCLGKGAFYNNFPKNVKKIYCEINEGKDYLLHTEMVDYTVSNPPFVPRKLFWDFMEKAMDTTRKNIYWLINISSLNVFTPKRLQIMKDKNWYIESFYIVSDKRWFGRYVFIKIGKENKNIFNFTKTIF